MFTATAILNMMKRGDFNGVTEACLTQIRIEEAEKLGKPATKKTRITALQNCLSKDPYREKLTVAYMEEGKQTFCNGHLGVALNDPIPEVKMGKDEERFAIVKMIAESKGTGMQESAEAIKKLVAETIADNKARIKADKHAIENPAVTEKSCRIGFNPVYMHNVIIGLGGYDSCTITWPEKAIAPIHIESELGSAMVLPIRIKDKDVS